MAKGKQAALAANRRAESAHEVIDRLTSDLADAKLRARQAEQRATRLEGIEKLLAASTAVHDELLADAVRALKRWSQVQGEDKRRRNAGLVELFVKVFRDLDLPRGGTPEDKRQLLYTRYPAIVNALLAGALDVYDPKDAVSWPDSPSQSFERKLSAEDLRRFQRAYGERRVYGGAPDKDFADLYNDLLDAKQLGFSGKEFLELFDTVPA